MSKQRAAYIRKRRKRYETLRHQSLLAQTLASRKNAILSTPQMREAMGFGKLED